MPIELCSLKIRTLFISDLHLGFRLSKARACLDLLRAVRPRQIYLVGDTIDAWRLADCWHWPDLHREVVSQLVAMQQSGVDVCVCPGNHDDCFRDDAFVSGLPSASQKKLYDVILPILNLTRSESFVHVTVGGRRLLVTHGDQYDDVVDRTGGVSILGRRIFDRFSWLVPDSGYHRIRRFFKRCLARPGKIQRGVIDEARKQQLDGIIFGHIHRPAIHVEDNLIVANTGDWVENESFLAELENGTLRLVNFGQTITNID